MPECLDSLLDLVAASKCVPANPVTCSTAFSKAFKFIDEKISSTTGWSEPNSNEFSVHVTKLHLKPTLENLSKDVLTYNKSNWDKPTKLNFVSEDNIINYFQSGKLDNAHNSKSLHLAGKLFHPKNPDTEREYSLRQ